jgi:Fe-only nitrogenase accessory protein AnfO
LKIAVVEDNNQKTSSIFESGFIAVYEEDEGEWKVLNRFENKVCDAKGISAVRMAVEDAVKQLGDVRIVVASDIPGIAFGVFQASNFSIFLVKDCVLDILDSIKKEMLEITEKRQEEPQKFDIMQFLKHGVNKGDFFLNLEEIMLKNSDLSSKKILIPYLKDKGFNNLDIVFSHIPKWFDTELTVLGFKYEIVSELPNKMTIRIKNTQTL